MTFSEFLRFVSVYKMLYGGAMAREVYNRGFNHFWESNPTKRKAFEKLGLTKIIF